MERKYTVSELTDLIKSALEGQFGEVVVEGEASNCKPSSAGHLYFSLKDANAVIPCVFFKGRFGRRSIPVKDGALLRVRGRLSVYPPRGAYQIVCEDVELAGEGDILLLLERRKRALAAEGLFDEDRKKPLPRFPLAVAVVTAKTGAVIHDIITTLRRRAPNVRVVLLPAAVQGEGASASIAARIRQANGWKLGEVLIVARGGGSVEDLLPFSDEAVVRAVAGSSIPVISAVGHDTDWALCDYAADLRAPTPTAAAELVSENWIDMAGQLRSFRENLIDMMYAKIDYVKMFMKPFGREEFAFRFQLIVQPRSQRLDDAREALCAALRERLSAVKRRIEFAAAVLENNNPRAIMERGYAVVTQKDTNALIKRAQDLNTGDMVNIMFGEGKAEAEITAI